MKQKGVRSTNFKKSDDRDVKNLYLNPEARKYLGGIRQEDAIKVQLNVMLNPRKNTYYWVVREKRTGNFIGLVSLDPHHEGNYREVSYQFYRAVGDKGTLLK